MDQVKDVTRPGLRSTSVIILITITLPVLVMFVALRRSFVESIAASGVKG